MMKNLNYDCGKADMKEGKCIIKPKKNQHRNRGDKYIENEVYHNLNANLSDGTGRKIKEFR